MTDILTLDQFRKFVDGDAVAIRGKAVLQPAGGPGDKVFPPTHSKSDDELRRLRPDQRVGAKYALEKRRLPGGEIVDCVLLDSVQSQANRLEQALHELWDKKKIALPVVSVDFTRVAPEVGRVTSLTAPHRIADALLRDSMYKGTLFRMSDLGRSFTEASARQAAPLFKVCPTGLVFGLWDSTGPKGGLGAKFARALSSEIVGIGAECGVKTSSRIDPAGIVTGAGKLFIKRASPGELPTWTPDESEAEMDEGKPLPLGSKRKKDGKWSIGDGKPSEANHSNIPPTIDEVAGGVTFERAEQTVVLSLAALRRLSFPVAEGEKGGDVEVRTVLAALGLLAALAATEAGHDLRSRCLLVPIAEGGALRFEVIDKHGKPSSFALSLDEATKLYQAAVAALPPPLRFTPWGSDEDLEKGACIAELTPSDKLAFLIRESRRLAAAGADVEGA